MAGGAGIVGGTVAGQVAGGNGKFAGLGGLGGSLAGFIIGNAIAPGIGGVIGAGAGGAIGSFGGSFIGAENNLGNDNSAQVYNSRQGRIVYSDSSFSPENRSVTGGVLGEVAALQDALADLGATFAAFNLRLEAGNKSGITVNGKKYPDVQAALTASIEKLLGGTSGLSGTQSTILQNSKGANANEILGDLAFGQTYDQLTFTGTEFERALKAVNDNMDDAARKARALGLEEGALTAARERATAQLQFTRDQDQRRFYEQTALLQGDGSLGTALHILETQMRDLAVAAQELGVPLARVTETHQLAAQQLYQQYSQGQRRFYEQNAAVHGDSSLPTQLHGLETQMRDLAQAAIALGIPLEVVYETHRIAAQRLVEANAELQRDFADQLAALDAGPLTACADRHRRPVPRSRHHRPRAGRGQ